MGFPSVCYKCVLLPLFNKEAALSYGRTEYSKAGDPSRDRGGRKVESGRLHVATQKGRTTSLTVKWKVIEIG